MTEPGLSLNVCNQYCPECGAGTVPHGEGNGMLIRVGKYYPYSECQTCKQRAAETMRAAGEREALRREKDNFGKLKQ